METFVDLIELWPSMADFASDAGVPYGTAKQWKLRKSIPPAYWPPICQAAERRNLDGISIETLAALVQPRKRPAGQAA